MNDRAGEDPVSTIMSALEDLVKAARNIDHKIMRSLYLLLLWLAFAFILWAFSVVHLTIFDIISYAILIVLVLLVMLHMVDMRESMAVVVSRYQAYKFIENAGNKIPDGMNPVERFLNYLNMQFKFEDRLTKRNGKLTRSVEINGVKFDVYVEIKKRHFEKILGIKSYSMYIKSVDTLNAEKLKEIIEAAKNYSISRNLEIGRISILTAEVDNEAYSMLTSDELSVPVQAVLEMEDGTYDFIPFIGPRPDLLP